MSLTLEQRTNINGMPKAAELIEITGAHALEASDRAILNLLYQHAHDSGRLGDPAATWELPITALRPSKHNGTDRIRDSLSRLLSVQVKVAYREGKTGRDRVIMTHLSDNQSPYPVTGLAQGRLVREAMRSGISMSLFQAFWHASRMAS